MTTYEKNLKTLAFHYLEIDKRIENAKENMEMILEVQEEKSYEGEKILKIKKEDRVCYLNGKRDTSEAAKYWVKTLGVLHRNTPILMMGIGNYSYLKELAKQTENRLIIVVYEPSLQIFLKFLEMIDIKSWMERHLIIFWVDGVEGMDEKNMREVLEQVLKYEALEYCKYFILPNYDTLFAEKALMFVKTCRDVALKEVSRFATNNLFAGVMVKNLFSNAKYLCNGYKTTQLTEVIPRDIPGIVVAAGPSLDKNIRELKNAKGKAFIVAVDTAIKPLLREGIIPDMFAVIDALKPLELVKVEEARQIPLLSTLNASPEILDYHKGMKFFFNEGYLFAEEIFRRSGHRSGDVSCGGSVATSLFSLLYKIGIQTIILVGQDLAYTDNKSYANGTFHDVIEEEDTSKFMMVKGNFEEKVPTQPNLKLFLDWYNRYIEGIKERDKGFRVINATEGGAFIRNTEIMTLREAIEQECNKSVNIQECLERLPLMLNEEAQKWSVEYLKSLSKEFKTIKNDARKLRNLYYKLYKLCNKRNVDCKEYRGILKKIDNQKKVLERASIYQLITITMSNAQYILLEEQYEQRESLQEEGKEIAQTGITYIKDVEKCAEIFQEYSEEVFRDL